jgi:hypothetical protein
MALWEYKVITSGRGGFASPALLETYLNQLGTDEWEIIEFRTQPDNPLAFSGLARRTTQRDWTLEAAAAAAARVEADKLRAEFAAKFQGATSASSEQPAAAEGDAETTSREEGLRSLRNTEYDQDPDSLDDSSSDDDAEQWPEADHLPSFFEAIRPHMRRNQKGPGHSVGVDYLVKKFDMIEDDLLNALRECGFAVPEDEDDKPVYVEYDEDLYWLNINRRGELWINMREKPRPVFRTVKATRVTPEVEEKREDKREEQQHSRRREQQERPSSEPPRVSESEKPAAEASPAAERSSSQAATPEATAKTAPEPAAPLPPSHDFLNKLRPMMRRTRGGWSGTISYLSRALRQSDADLLASLATLGLVPPATPADKAPVIESGALSYWLNRDNRGGIWINGRETRRMRADERQDAPEAKPGDAVAAPEAGPTPATDEAPTAAEAVQPASEASASVPSAITIPVSTPAPETVPAAIDAAPVQAAPSEEVPVPGAEPPFLTPPPSSLPLSGARLLLRQSKTGSFSGELCSLAEQLSKTPDDFLAVLVAAGLKVPEKPREKPVWVEHAGEIFWLNRTAKGELWLNAKASKYSATETSRESAAAEGDAPASDKPSRRRPLSRNKSSE